MIIETNFAADYTESYFKRVKHPQRSKLNCVRCKRDFVAPRATYNYCMNCHRILIKCDFCFIEFFRSRRNYNYQKKIGNNNIRFCSKCFLNTIKVKPKNKNICSLWSCLREYFKSTSQHKKFFKNHCSKICYDIDIDGKICLRCHRRYKPTFGKRQKYCNDFSCNFSIENIGKISLKSKRFEKRSRHYKNVNQSRQNQKRIRVERRKTSYNKTEKS